MNNQLNSILQAISDLKQSNLHQRQNNLKVNANYGLSSDFSGDNTIQESPGREL